MKFIGNISLRYKLLSGFFVVLFILGWFGIYFLFIFNDLHNSVLQLDYEAKKQTLYLSLRNDTAHLSDSVKSYILTRDPKLQSEYDSTALDLSTLMEKINQLQDSSEVKYVKEIEATQNKLIGTELLILAETKEGQIDKATQLFDLNYKNQQIQEENLVQALIDDENSDFTQSFTDHNKLLGFMATVFISVLVLVLLFTLVFALTFTFIVTKSIKRLVASVEKFGKGDLGSRVVISSRDEIGHLGDAFNDMAGKLEESHSNLEQKIDEKTRQLQEAKKNIEQKLTQILEQNLKLEDGRKEMLQILSDLTHEKVKDDAILQSVGEGLIVTDKDGKILVVNKAATEMLQIKSEELVAKQLWEALHMTDIDNHPIKPDERPIQMAINYMKKITGVYYYARANGENFPAGLTVTPFSLDDKVIGAIEVFRDITKEKAIDQAKTEFVSLASHQLRTPLSAISWYTEMLLAGDAGEINVKQKQFLEEVYSGYKRMSELVNSLLNVSRIELGTFSINPEPTNFAEQAKSVVHEMAEQIQIKQLRVNEEYDGGLPIIQADPKLTRIIFQNLIANAVKYTPEKGVISVRLSLNKTDEAGDAILIEVADNGYGIPKNQQDKIFTKLFRAENVKQKVTEGTGLGLYIVKSIAEHAGGKVWFDSEENMGTTFSVTIPTKGMEGKDGSKALN